MRIHLIHRQCFFQRYPLKRLGPKLDKKRTVFWRGVARAGWNNFFRRGEKAYMSFPRILCGASQPFVHEVQSAALCRLGQENPRAKSSCVWSIATAAAEQLSSVMFFVGGVHLVHGTCGCGWVVTASRAGRTQVGTQTSTAHGTATMSWSPLTNPCCQVPAITADPPSLNASTTIDGSLALTLLSPTVLTTEVCAEGKKRCTSLAQPERAGLPVGCKRFKFCINSAQRLHHGRPSTSTKIIF